MVQAVRSLDDNHAEDGKEDTEAALALNNTSGKDDDDPPPVPLLPPNPILVEWTLRVILWILSLVLMVTAGGSCYPSGYEHIIVPGFLIALVLWRVVAVDKCTPKVEEELQGWKKNCLNFTRHFCIIFLTLAALLAYTLLTLLRGRFGSKGYPLTQNTTNDTSSCVPPNATQADLWGCNVLCGLIYFAPMALPLLDLLSYGGILLALVVILQKPGVVRVVQGLDSLGLTASASATALFCGVGVAHVAWEKDWQLVLSLYLAMIGWGLFTLVAIAAQIVRRKKTWILVFYAVALFGQGLLLFLLAYGWMFGGGNSHSEESPAFTITDIVTRYEEVLPELVFGLNDTNAWLLLVLLSTLDLILLFLSLPIRREAGLLRVGCLSALASIGTPLVILFFPFIVVWTPIGLLVGAVGLIFFFAQELYFRWKPGARPKFKGIQLGERRLFRGSWWVGVPA